MRGEEERADRILGDKLSINANFEIEELKGNCSPVWSFTWRSRLLLCLNNRWQYSHRKGIWSEWIFGRDMTMSEGDVVIQWYDWQKKRSCYRQVLKRILLVNERWCFSDSWFWWCESKREWLLLFRMFLSQVCSLSLFCSPLFSRCIYRWFRPETR